MPEDYFDIKDLVKRTVEGFAEKFKGIKQNISKILAETSKEIDNEFKKISQTFKNVGTGIGTFLFNPLKAGIGVVKAIGKGFGKVFSGPKAEGVKRFGKNMGSLVGGMLGPLGSMLSLFESMGVFEPLFDVIGGLMEMFGGILMEALMPAFKALFDVLLSPEVIDIIKILAQLFGAILTPIIMVFAEVLTALSPVFKILGKILISLMPVITLLAKLFAGVLGVALKIFANILIIVYNVVAGIINAIIWIVNLFGAGIPYVEYLPLVPLQHGGIITGPTQAKLGENRKKEAVIPLESQKGKDILSNEEVVWAIEDNGEKLDMIYGTLRQGQRLR